MGLSEVWMLNHQIEARQDDDVDTDDDVQSRAQTLIRNDLRRSERDIKKKGWSKLVNNCNIEDRVEFPDKYDREAQLIRIPRR